MRRKWLTYITIIGLIGAQGTSIYATAPSNTYDLVVATTTSTQTKKAEKHVVILATGGTIAGKGAAGKTTNYKAGELDVESLVASVPGIEDLAELSGVQVCNVGSDNITYDKWKTMADTINQLAQDDSVDGFVITHGTDTLEETAFFLNLTAHTNKPIVVTGAMRPSTATSADGPMNLYQAVALASSEEAIGKGVLVVFSDGIYAARDVQKINSFKTDAFNSKDFGALGYMRDNVPYFYTESTRKHTTQSEFDVSNVTELPKVGIAYFHIDADPFILDYLAKNNDGIVIAGAGEGSMSSAWSQKVAELESKGIPVIRSTRISNGMVQGDAYTFNPQKARILLQLALTKTKDLDQIQKIFEAY